MNNFMVYNIKQGTVGFIDKIRAYELFFKLEGHTIVFGINEHGAMYVLDRKD